MYSVFFSYGMSLTRSRRLEDVPVLRDIGYLERQVVFGISAGLIFFDCFYIHSERRKVNVLTLLYFYLILISFLHFLNNCVLTCAFSDLLAAPWRSFS